MRSDVEDKEDCESLKDTILDRCFTLFESNRCKNLEITKENAETYFTKNVTDQKQDKTLHVDSLEIEGYPFCWLREEKRVSKQKFEVNFKVSSKKNIVQISYCPLAQTEAESSYQYRLRAPSDLVLGMEVNKERISIDLLQPLLERKITQSSRSSEWIRFEDNRLTPAPIYRLHINLNSITQQKFSQLCQSLEASQFSDVLIRGLQTSYTGYEKALKNPEQHFPILTDPKLVHATQLALKSLYTQVNSQSIQDKIAWSAKMYDGLFKVFKELLHSRFQVRASSYSSFPSASLPPEQ